MARQWPRFFRNADGEVVIAQRPNFALMAWLALMLAAHFAGDARWSALLGFFSAAFLFAWAYMELTRGDSPFRRALGGAVLAWMLAARVYRLFGA